MEVSGVFSKKKKNTQNGSDLPTKRERKQQDVRLNNKETSFLSSFQQDGEELRWHPTLQTWPGEKVSVNRRPKDLQQANN